MLFLNQNLVDPPVYVLKIPDYRAGGRADAGQGAGYLLEHLGDDPHLLA